MISTTKNPCSSHHQPRSFSANQDLVLLFRGFAHAEDRGHRLSPAELQQLLRAVHEDGRDALPQGFPERLYEAWAPQGGRFKAGFKVYMQQRESWLEQWWLALSAGSSNQAPNQRLVAEVRKDQSTVNFEQFQQFCDQLAEESGQFNPPLSFLHAVWRAALPADSSTTIGSGSQLLQILPLTGHLRPISDAAYDALLQAYSEQWQAWLEDWISERMLDEEEKAAIVVQRHFRAYQARKEVKNKRLELFLGEGLEHLELPRDLAGTMKNRERALKLFLQFSGGKNHWTGDDMSNFCTAIWKQDGSLAALVADGTRSHQGLPPPVKAFGDDALKKLQKMAVGKGKELLGPMVDVQVKRLAAGQVVTRDDFRRGLMLWNQRHGAETTLKWTLRFRQLQKWEQARYSAVYVCPCCRGRFRLAKVMEGGRVWEVAKVVDTGAAAWPGPDAKSYASTWLRGVTPGVTSLTGRLGPPRFAVPGGRPTVAGSAARKLPHPNEVAMLHNQAPGGAALCLLPPGSARPALAGRLLLQAAVSGSSTGAPLLLLADDQELEAVRLWLASAAPKYQAPVVKASLQQRLPVAKVTGQQLATIVLATAVTLERLALETTSLEPRDTASASAMDGASHPWACLEDFSQHISRYPDVVHVGGEAADSDELPLGFTGPLQPLKRLPVIRSKQDDMSSDEEPNRGLGVPTCCNV
eukprot:Skav204712  [mRNA]  locus=scaffold3332:217703:230672:- [translate_table: standard]